MSKISLTPITNGQNLSSINNNFDEIEDALNNQVLYRSNSVGQPNQMANDLDMNGNDILNVGTLQTADITVGGGSVVGVLTQAQLAATNAALSATQSAASAVNAHNSELAAAASVGSALQKVNNLSDLASVATAKTNLALVKADVGLGNVDNTSDVNKPVSTATTTQLNLKAPIASPTFTGTVTIPSGASIAGYAPTASPTFTGTVNAATLNSTGGALNGSLGATSQAGAQVTTLLATGLTQLNGGTKGQTTAAAAGNVGELLTATAASVAVTSGASNTIVSLSVTPGVWDISGVIQWIPAGTTVMQLQASSINTVTNTSGTIGQGNISEQNATTTAGNGADVATPVVGYVFTTTTTVYLVATQFFTTSTCTASGFIRARRVI